MFNARYAVFNALQMQKRAQQLCSNNLQYGGEDGIRTHAPVTQPNGLANRPLEPLEYFSEQSNLFNFGGGDGIRTHVGLHPNGFQDRPVMTTSVPLHILFYYILQT